MIGRIIEKTRMAIAIAFIVVAMVMAIYPAEASAKVAAGASSGGLMQPGASSLRAGDVELLAQIMYMEARGVEGKTEQAAVAWCVLNRVDDKHWPNTVAGVVKQKHQFAYDADAPVTDELLSLAKDVLLRYQLEKLGVGECGRVLPRQYVFFAGDGTRNWFRTTYRGGMYWNWKWESPYEG